MEGHSPCGGVALCTEWSNGLHPCILAPGTTGHARIIASGVTGCKEMFQIWVQNENVMEYVVVMWGCNIIYNRRHTNAAVHAQACTHICAGMYLDTQACTSTQAYTQVHTYTCRHAQRHRAGVHVRRRACMRRCTHTHIQAHTNACSGVMCTGVHIHMYAHALVCTPTHIHNKNYYLYRKILYNSVQKFKNEKIGCPTLLNNLERSSVPV